MREWIPIDQTKHFDVVNRTIEAPGISGVVSGVFSPFDVPVAARFDLNVNAGTLRYEFRYLGPLEKDNPEPAIDGLRVGVGVQSNRIYWIEAIVPHLDQVPSYVIQEVERRVRSGLEELVGTTVEWNWFRRLKAFPTSMRSANEGLARKTQGVFQPT